MKKNYVQLGSVKQILKFSWESKYILLLAFKMAAEKKIDFWRLQAISYKSKHVKDFLYCLTVFISCKSMLLTSTLESMLYSFFYHMTVS